MRSKIRFFFKRDENIIIYYVFEHSEKPVSAWEREARWKEESCPKIVAKAACFLSALLCSAGPCSVLLDSGLIQSIRFVLFSVIFCWALLCSTEFSHSLSWGALLDFTLQNSPPLAVLCHTALGCAWCALLWYAVVGCAPLFCSALTRSALLWSD